MNKVDYLAIFLVGVLLVGYSWGWFELGKRYEYFYLHPIIEKMSKDLCDDCDKVGYTQGLATCQDSLNQEDERNKR